METMLEKNCVFDNCALLMKWLQHVIYIINLK